MNRAMADSAGDEARAGVPAPPRDVVAANGSPATSRAEYLERTDRGFALEEKRSSDASEFVMP
jgi:hypothetical protein